MAVDIKDHARPAQAVATRRGAQSAVVERKRRGQLGRQHARGKDSGGRGGIGVFGVGGGGGGGYGSTSGCAAAVVATAVGIAAAGAVGTG